MRRHLVAALLGLLVLAALPAHAGIVIMKKGGNVFIGRIEEGDVNSKTITLRAPRSEPGGPRMPESKMSFDRGDVRWFDAVADEPTDIYFKQFLDEPLDPPYWRKYADEYRKWLKLKPGPVDPTVIRERLVPVGYSRRFAGCEVVIRRPMGWNVIEAEGLVMFESPDRRARIHVFASDFTGEKALAVTRSALDRLGTRFDSVTKTETAPAHQDWLTTFERNGRNVHALRRIVQTDRSTAFAAAYAQDQDWLAVLPLVRESLDTFQAHEK